MEKSKTKFSKLSQILDKPTQSAILGAIILLLILVIIFLSGYFYTKQNTYTKATSKIIGEVEEEDSDFYERNYINNRTGLVTKVTNSAVYFSSTYVEDMKIIESEIEAKIEAATSLVKKDLYEISRAGSSSTDQTGVSPISLSEIKVGDKVTAYSDNNIKHTTSYLANKIEVLYESQEF